MGISVINNSPVDLRFEGQVAREANGISGGMVSMTSGTETDEKLLVKSGESKVIRFRESYINRLEINKFPKLTLRWFVKLKVNNNEIARATIFMDNEEISVIRQGWVTFKNE